MLTLTWFIFQKILNEKNIFRTKTIEYKIKHKNKLRFFNIEIPKGKVFKSLYTLVKMKVFIAEMFGRNVCFIDRKFLFNS